MNSLTGESGPVSIDRPRPAFSHEVPGRVPPVAGWRPFFFFFLKPQLLQKLVFFKIENSAVNLLY
jgi:hypothetical protein